MVNNQGTESESESGTSLDSASEKNHTEEVPAAGNELENAEIMLKKLLQTEQETQHDASNEWEEKKKTVIQYNFYGDNLNITQAETIIDSSIQSSEKNIHADISQASPQTIDEFEIFLIGLYPGASFFQFLTIALLGVVEENSLYEIAEKLRGNWCRTVPVDVGMEKNTQTSLNSTFSIQRELHVESHGYLMCSHAGEVPFLGFRIADEMLREHAAHWFWTLYPHHRETIADWLFDLTHHHAALVTQNAYKAIERCSQFSFIDFQRFVLPHFTGNPTPKTIGWLAEILQNLLRNHAFTDNIQASVHNWVAQANSPMSLLGFYLFDTLDEEGLSRRLSKLLTNLFLQERANNDRRRSILLTAVSSVRINPKLYLLFLSALSSASEMAKTLGQRARLMDTLLDLAVFDYWTVGRKYPRLLLLDLQDSFARKAITPLLLEAWKTHSQRLKSVWNAYFNEAAEQGYSLEYTRLFWRRLAFQHSAVEFRRVCYYLRDLARQQPSLADFFQSMCAELDEKHYQKKIDRRRLV